MYTRSELAEKLAAKEVAFPYGLLANEYDDIIKHLQYQNKLSKGLIKIISTKIKKSYPKKNQSTTSPPSS